MVHVMLGLSAFCLIIMVTTTSAAIMGVSDMISSTEVDVTVNSGRLKRSTGRGPLKTLDMTVDVDGVAVTKSLNLIGTHDDVIMYVPDNGEIKLAEYSAVKRKWATYGSDDASMLVKEHAEHGSRLEGSFIHDNAHYFIQPVDHSKRHVLHKVAHLSDEPISKETQKHLREKRSDQLYEIEQAMVMDKGLYYRFQKITKPGENTLELMKEYYGIIINEMDFRYKSLNKYKMKIRILMGELLIDSDGTLKPYPRPSSITTPVNIHDVVYQFVDWVKKKLPGRDNVQLHLGQPVLKHILGTAPMTCLCLPRSVAAVMDLINFAVAGISAHELGHNLGMTHDSVQSNPCRRGNVMYPSKPKVLYERKMFKVPWASWREFSQCSYSDAKKYIETLDKTKNNCMLKRTHGAPELAKYGKTFPGTKVTLEEQCVRTLGAGSTFCKTMQYSYDHTGEGVCVGIWCRNPRKSGDDTDMCEESFSDPGTTCGNFKICKLGKCVEDKALGKPVKNESCLFGDYDGNAVGWRTGRGEQLAKTCKDTAGTDPGFCYKKTPNVETICCGTCDKLRKEPSGPCRYGEYNIVIYVNRTTQYDCQRAIDIAPGVCYTHERRCCKACPKVISPKGGSCAYGDKIPTRPIMIDRKSYYLCSDAIKVSTGICYKHEHTCCKSCKPLKKDNRECEYGNRPGKVVLNRSDNKKYTCDFITDKTSWACYNGDTASKCCASCAPYRTDDRNCRYGNRLTRVNGKATSCSDLIKTDADSYHCYKHNRDCCGTCKKYKTKDRRRPSTFNHIPRMRIRRPTSETKGTGRLYVTHCKETFTSNIDAGYSYTYVHQDKKQGFSILYKRVSFNITQECEFGDQLVKQKELGGGTCKDTITSKDEAGYCYEYNVSKKCCATCKSYKTREYGSYCDYGNKKGKLNGKDVNCEAEATKKKCRNDWHFGKHCCATCSKVRKSR